MENIYDAENLRSISIENGKYNRYVYIGSSIACEVDEDWGLKDRIVRGHTILQREGSNKDTHCYIHNAHGDITALTDSRGEVLNSYSYDAFGNILDSVEKVDNRFKYSGELHDPVTDQYYLRARYYNPNIGRFMQEDTFRGDGLNLYTYVANNPIKYIDPTGHCKEGVDFSEVYDSILGNNPNDILRTMMGLDWTSDYFKNFEVGATATDEVSEDEYNKAKNKLWDAVYKQYPLARVRFIKKNQIENALKEYKDLINETAKKYEVPPELIAGIIVKEQITQSAPDIAALADILIRGREHTVGLGAIFPSTAKEAWWNVDVVGAYKNKIYGTNAEIEFQLAADNETNINTIAVVLNYYARQKFDITDVSSLTMEQWKEVVGRYNASDDNPEAQNKYSDYVYDYLEPIRTMLK
ncbi:hypothetical protein A7W90_00545 [Clostridium sp. Bc-iso-3]|nr:hypothetical protein A7W90_00545 [Clostridium sp. Bc-iso-3]